MLFSTCLHEDSSAFPRIILPTLLVMQKWNYFALLTVINPSMEVLTYYNVFTYRTLSHSNRNDLN